MQRTFDITAVLVADRRAAYEAQATVHRRRRLARRSRRDVADAPTAVAGPAAIDLRTAPAGASDPTPAVTGRTPVRAA